jgi:glutaminyl-tRNA synthetase
MSNVIETTSNFIRTAIDEDLAAGRYRPPIRTRFPPEPNGYLHIGHAKAICLNHGIAQDYGGQFNLRFDDTNPLKEEQEYIDAIIEDMRWLGADWEDRLFFASDYFEQLYRWAVQLIEQGQAYVDDLSAVQIREYRGTLTEPGQNSPYRDRSVEENLDLFGRMRQGDFPDGARVLRAKIDMSSPNINLRDPVMYRILHAEHPRTGDAWCIYPTYDWAHGQCDSIEAITHSICTLEFEDHRPLYEWFLDSLGVYRPRQIEFARLNLTHTVMSKRKLRRLVAEGRVRGWDDPRLPTISAMRRRGYTSEAIRTFCDLIGVSKSNSMVELALLEHVVRDDLNHRAPRAMAVLDPLRLVIENYPEDRSNLSTSPPSPRTATTRTPTRCPSRAKSTSSARTSWKIRRASSSAWLQGGKCACWAPTTSPAAR